MTIIRRFRITVLTFIRNEIPAHQRGYADALAFFRGLLAPLKQIADEWLTFRDASVTRAKVSGETISLQWYLNYLFDPEDQSIYILTAGPSGVLAGDEATEPAAHFAAGDEATEPSVQALAGAEGEGTDFRGRSFCVFVPTVILATDAVISAVVQQYKLAGKTFLVQRIF